MKRFLSAAIAAATALTGRPAAAAVVFTARTRLESPTARMVSLSNATVRGWIDGDRGRIEFLESANRATPKGGVILTSDGGKTARFFDPEAKTCRPWAPLGGPARPGPAVAGAPAGVRNLAVEKTLEEDGPRIAGRPTRHYRFTVAYDETSGAARWRVEKVEDVWADRGLSDPALALWLSAAAAKTRSAELDQKIAEAMAGVRGAALLRVTVERVAFEGRPPQTVTTTLEVSELGQRAVPASTFLEPFPCKIPGPEDRR